MAPCRRLPTVGHLGHTAAATPLGVRRATMVDAASPESVLLVARRRMLAMVGVAVAVALVHALPMPAVLVAVRGAPLAPRLPSAWLGLHAEAVPAWWLARRDPTDTRAALALLALEGRCRRDREATAVECVYLLRGQARAGPASRRAQLDGRAEHQGLARSANEHPATRDACLRHRGRRSPRRHWRRRRETWSCRWDCP